MSYTELGLLEKWLRSTLTGSALTALGLNGTYGYLIPQGQSSPNLVFGLVSGDDDNTLTGIRNGTDFVFYVKCVDVSTDSARAETIMQAADSLLQQASVTTTGLVIRSCHREQTIKYPDVYEGKTAWHVGGNYRIEVGQG